MKEKIESENLDQKLEKLRPVIDTEIQRVKTEIAEQKNIDSEDFDLRGELYRLAFEVAPEARDQDLINMKEWIKPQEGEVALDIAAGTGFLTIPLTNWTNGKTYAVDPSEVQLRNLEKKKGDLNIKTVVGSLSDIETMQKIGEAGSIDLITSYGGIHHILDKDCVNRQRKLFENAATLLKSGGRFVAGDVGANTKLAEHFETSVKDHCLTGHTQKWLSEERLKTELTEGTDLEFIKSEILLIQWLFDNKAQLALFMKGLHAYDMTDDEILEDLNSHLGYEVIKGKYKLNWPMLFFELRKK